MSISSAVVKKTAKTAIKGKYLKGIIAAAVYTFIWLVCLICTEMLSSFAGIFAGLLFFISLLVFLLLPLTFGYVYWGVRVIFSGEAEPLLLFNYFKDASEYKRALKLSAFLSGKTVVTGAILFVPAFITDLIASGKVFTMLGAQIPVWASGLWTVSGILKTIAVICTVLVLLKYYLSPYLLAADENMDPVKAVYLSKIIHSRSGKDFLWLILSFSFLIIACLFLVPLIFIFPLFNVCYAVHCRFSVTDYNKNIDKINRKDIPTFNADISF